MVKQKLFFESKQLEDNYTIDHYNIQNKSILYLSYYSKEINIKFIKAETNINKSYNSIFQLDEELYGLLKLCFLKELSSKFNDQQIKELPEFFSIILRILKNGNISDPIKKEEIKKVLEKLKGSNFLNFSRYIDKAINSNDIKMLLQFLKNDDLEEMKDIKKRLLDYNEYIKLFEKDFEERKRNSIFEFSMISLVVMEREDFQTFKKERQNCPNRVDRIIYIMEQAMSLYLVY